MSSSDAPINLMMRFGDETNPSSSARIDRWKYRSCVVDGISRNISVSMMSMLNMRFFAILSPDWIFLCTH